MALLLNNCTIKNTELAIENVYGRVQFVANMDGKTTPCSISYYENKEAFAENKSILVNAPDIFLLIMEDGEVQDLSTIHSLLKTKLEDKGFEVTIEL
jgi:hypothetical protein